MEICTYLKITDGKEGNIDRFTTDLPIHYKNTNSNHILYLCDNERVVPYKDGRKGYKVKETGEDVLEYINKDLIEGEYWTWEEVVEEKGIKHEHWIEMDSKRVETYKKLSASVKMNLDLEDLVNAKKHVRKVDPDACVEVRVRAFHSVEM